MEPIYPDGGTKVSTENLQKPDLVSAVMKHIKKLRVRLWGWVGKWVVGGGWGGGVRCKKYL